MSDFIMNRLANSSNIYQGKFKRVWWVCSAGLLRSPTAAFVLSQEPYNFNTRAAGLTKEFALVPVDEVLIHWADEIVCMSNEQAEQLADMAEEGKRIVSLNIADSYRYRDPELINLIRSKYDSVLGEPTNG